MAVVLFWTSKSIGDETAAATADNVMTKTTNLAPTARPVLEEFTYTSTMMHAVKDALFPTGTTVAASALVPTTVTS